MVPHTRKALRTDTLKAVNVPEEVAVEENGRGSPWALKGKRKQAVLTIEDTWRLDDEWWRAVPLTRLYFAVIFFSRQGIIIFKDLQDNRWYRQAY